MVADHSDEPRSSMSSSHSNSSSLFTGRVNGGRHAPAPHADTRRHSSHSLRRFPSLTSMTELFQPRSRPRLGPALMRRKITHLFNPNQHRRATSDTTFLSRDTAPHQDTTVPVIPQPLRLDDPTFIDDWSAFARDIERSASSRRQPTASIPSARQPESDRAATDRNYTPADSALPPPSSSMPAPHRRHRSSASRRGKRTISTVNSGARASFSADRANAAISATIEVILDTDVVDIVGSPNTSVTYSLPGAVFLTFPVLPNREGDHVRLLHDVSVVLEGKAEYWDDFGRFSPFRLYTTTLPLIPADSPVVIPSASPDSTTGPFVTLRFDFDLRLPGWLPPSLRISGRGSCAGVGYGVVATAVTSWCDARMTPSMHRLSGLVQKSAFSPYTEFIVRRHQMPTAITPNAPIESRSFIHIEEETFSYDINLGTAILPVEATFTVPEVIDIYGDERALSVGIRIRIQPDAYHAYRLSRAILLGDTSNTDPTVAYLMELGMIVEERQRFSSTPFGHFTGYFPVPTEQPAYSSQYSLLGPRFAAQEESIVCPNPSLRCRKDVLRPCLLSDEGFQRNFVFEDGGIGLSDRWRRINVVLLLPSRHGSGAYRPRPGTFSPFVHISHSLKTFCTLRTPGVNPETRPITFTTALKFATNPSSLPSSGADNPPPFLQLYDESGEPRLPDPLPLYSPACEAKELVVDLTSSDLSVGPESPDEATARRPMGPKSRASPDLIIPGGPSHRDSISSPTADEEYPKPTLSRASGSRTRRTGLSAVAEQL